MANDYKAFGVTNKDIMDAALGDFDDYETTQTIKSKSESQQFKKSQAKPADYVSGLSSKQETGRIGKIEALNTFDETDEKKMNEVPQTETGIFATLYIFSFIKSLFTKNKIGVCIWMIVNLILVSGGPALLLIMAEADALSIVTVLAFGLISYFISLAAALSPIGEGILRWQNKCKKIKDTKTLDRLMPIFNDVYQRAKTKSPGISDKVKLFICRDESVNAFATGRRTVCVTQGLLQLSDEEIKGVLAHEFGHLSNKDTDVILAVSVGNMFVTGFLIVINLFINFLLRISDFIFKIIGSANYVNMNAFTYRIINALFYVLVYVWTKLGVLLCLHSSKKNEFAADKFAVDLGFKEELVEALTEIDDGDYSKPKGLWASLNSSHPETADRVAAMNEYALTKN